MDHTSSPSASARSALLIAARPWIALGLAFLSIGGDSVSAAGGNGRIGVQTQPSGAIVYIDGMPSGRSPAGVDGLAPGRYFVRVELDGYRAAELVVQLSAGEKYQSPTLTLVPEGAPLPSPAPAAPAPVAAATPRPSTPAPAPTSTSTSESRSLELGGIPLPSNQSPPRGATPAPAPAAPAVATPPAPTPPVPATVVPPSADPAPATLPPAASDEETQLRGLVNDYLTAIADGDANAFANLCAPTVDFYEDGSKSQAAIRRSRQQFKERWPVYQIENVRDLNVKNGEKPGVKRIGVTYEWAVSNPKTGKKASGTATDQLDFRSAQGQWQLTRVRQTVKRGGR